VVLATGMDGCGRGIIPDLVRGKVPRRLYAHSGDDIDMDSLRGKSVAVLGSASSAFDDAAAALEAGADEVRLFSGVKPWPIRTPSSRSATPRPSAVSTI